MVLPAGRTLVGVQQRCAVISKTFTILTLPPCYFQRQLPRLCETLLHYAEMD